MTRRSRAARPNQERTGPVWMVEVWRGFRPYLIRLSVDSCVFVAIWFVLVGAHVMTTLLPLGTALSRILVGFHEIVMVLTFVWLSLQAALDIAALRRRT